MDGPRGKAQTSGDHSTPGPAAEVLCGQRAGPVLARGHVRIGVAQQLPAVLRALGADPGSLIRRAGLEPVFFDDPDNPVTFPALGRLLRLSVAETGCQHFGLMVGQLASPSSLGIVGYLAQNSSTVHEALRILVEHLHLHDRGGAPNLAILGDQAIISYALYEPGVESADHIADASIATCCNIMRAMCGQDWAPTEVLLPRRQPADVTIYNRFYRAPIRFDQEIAALCFPKAWLDHAPPHADALLRRILEERVKELERSAARTVADPAEAPAALASAGAQLLGIRDGAHARAASADAQIAGFSRRGPPSSGSSTRSGSRSPVSSSLRRRCPLRRSRRRSTSQKEAPSPGPFVAGPAKRRPTGVSVTGADVSGLP